MSSAPSHASLQSALSLCSLTHFWVCGALSAQTDTDVIWPRFAGRKWEASEWGGERYQSGGKKRGRMDGGAAAAVSELGLLFFPLIQC